MSSRRRDTILKTCTSLCSAFATGAPVWSLLPYFAPGATATEHGPGFARSSLPFIDTFPSISAYFETVSTYLSYSSLEYFDWAVDEQAEIVTVKGKGTFVWKANGCEWDEIFVYVLSGFDEAGRIGKYEVWADPLSAYFASKGEIGKRE